MHPPSECACTPVAASLMIEGRNPDLQDRNYVRVANIALTSFGGGAIERAQVSNCHSQHPHQGQAPTKGHTEIIFHRYISVR
jgi:hypothetical protein